MRSLNIYGSVDTLMSSNAAEKADSSYIQGVAKKKVIFLRIVSGLQYLDLGAFGHRIMGILF